jgi:hypothetical protein
VVLKVGPPSSTRAEWVYHWNGIGNDHSVGNQAWTILGWEGPYASKQDQWPGYFWKWNGSTWIGQGWAGGGTSAFYIDDSANYLAAQYIRGASSGTVVSRWIVPILGSPNNPVGTPLPTGVCNQSQLNK